MIAALHCKANTRSQIETNTAITPSVKHHNSQISGGPAGQTGFNMRLKANTGPMTNKNGLLLKQARNPSCPRPTHQQNFASQDADWARQNQQH
jgi:hypothetical protein